LDGDTRGGAILSVREATGVPVRFIGLGELSDALDVFVPHRVAERILGMGDVLGLIAKAEEAIDQKQAAEIEASMKSGQFDFNLMLQQMRTVKKMGSIKNLIKMIPGLQTMIPEEAMDQVDDSKLGQVEAIILSMTPKERTNPDILNGSRRKRIAAGSGRTVEEVNRLVNQLHEMRRQMKQFSKMESRMKKMGKRR
jgi:signal recognition particle subunit SRP54